MTIDKQRIREAFSTQAWAYAESRDNVRIGKWHGDKGHEGQFEFFDGDLREDGLLTLRVFTQDQELKFSGNKCRDTEQYGDGHWISELEDARYYMYGEKESKQKESVVNEYIALTEDRGGILYFPRSNLSFPDNQNTPGEKFIRLKLRIRNFVRYNDVIVCPQREDHYGFGLDRNPRGAGAIEVIDYAYTGFLYLGKDGKDDEEVKL